MAKAKLLTLQANAIICQFRCSFFFFCRRDFMQFPIFRTFDKSVFMEPQITVNFYHLRAIELKLLDTNVGMDAVLSLYMINQKVRY